VAARCGKPQLSSVMVMEILAEALLTPRDIRIAMCNRGNMGGLGLKNQHVDLLLHMDNATTMLRSARP